MRVLAFERSGEVVHGRWIRRARFERRSSLPVSAACVVANGVRESLRALLAAPVVLRLLEPVIPDANAWNAICADALFFRVRGSACDAAFVLRPQDALALAGSAFGEETGGVRDLSPVEHEVLLRALRGIAGSLTPVCGRDAAPLERILDIRGYTTYFELLLEQPAAARIGVALSRDPRAPGGGTLRPDDLLDVKIDVAVQFARGLIPAAALLDLRPGTDVPMTTRIGEPGLLVTRGATLGRGQCGSIGERAVMIVTPVR